MAVSQVDLMIAPIHITNYHYWGIIVVSLSQNQNNIFKGALTVHEIDTNGEYFTMTAREAQYDVRQ